MMDKILLCTDLDRTLIPNGKQPESQGVRDLFSEVVDRDDVALAYVTGRHRELIEHSIEAYDLPTPDVAIADVGTTVYEINEGQWRQSQAWDEELAEDWGGLTADAMAPLLADINCIRLQEPNKQSKHKLSYYLDMDAEAHDVMAVIEQRLEDHGIHAKLVWSIDEENRMGLLDVLPANAGKRQAIEHVMDTGEIDAENTVFAGDSGNDLDVLLSPIPSILVANADHTVREAVEKTNPENTYLANGGFLGLNGFYASGILEGVAHFFPEMKPILEDIQDNGH